MKKAILIPILIIIFINLINADDYTPITQGNDDGDEYVYKIGADDELEINIWGYENLDRKVIVRPDGMITYEMIGDIHCVGLTPTQLSIKLSQLLSKYLREPTVIVKILQIKSQKATVIGDIPKQGTIYLRGQMKLLDILTECGYNPITSKVNEVTVSRKNNQAIKINLNELISSGDLSQNILIQNGDAIILPKNTSGQVIIEGEVGKAGEYDVEKNEKLRISDLIRKAGGLTTSAVKTNAKIIRSSGKETTRINLEALESLGDQSENYVLNPGDRLVIPRVKETRIYVYGENERVGEVIIKDAMPRVDKLLSLALDKYFAVLSNVKIIRDNPLSPGHPIIFSVDLKKVLYRNDASQNIKLENNDVVFLPQSWIGSFAQFLDEVWPNIKDGSNMLYDIKDLKDGYPIGESTNTNNNYRTRN